MSCVQGGNRSDRDVLLHEALLSAVLGENRLQEDALLHETLLNPGLGVNLEDLSLPKSHHHVLGCGRSARHGAGGTLTETRQPAHPPTVPPSAA